jgi:hypothetical protein
MKPYDCTADMQVPRYIPNQGWVIEVYDKWCELKQTKNPNEEQAKWIAANQVRASDLNATFHLMKRRKIGEIIAEARGTRYGRTDRHQITYQELMRAMGLTP